MASGTVYWGTRETMIAEFAAFDPSTIGISKSDCAYLAVPVGECEYGTEWAATKQEAIATASELANAFGFDIGCV